MTESKRETNPRHTITDFVTKTLMKTRPVPNVIRTLRENQPLSVRVYLVIGIGWRYAGCMSKDWINHQSKLEFAYQRFVCGMEISSLN